MSTPKKTAINWTMVVLVALLLTAGTVLVALGHEGIGASLITGAAGLALPMGVTRPGGGS